jgi:hypothetical protein
VTRHAEVDVHDEAAAPVMEEMLPVRLGAQESTAVQASRFFREAALRRRDMDDAAREIARLVAREAVDGVALGHRGSL